MDYWLSFFPGLFFYVHIEGPSPKNPKGYTPQAPNPMGPHELKSPTPIQDSNPKPPTPNHHKRAKMIKMYSEVSGTLKDHQSIQAAILIDL